MVPNLRDALRFTSYFLYVERWRRGVKLVFKALAFGEGVRTVPGTLHVTFHSPLSIVQRPPAAMDSLPQELVNEIIDNLPHSSLPSSSLISRRWQKRSQQLAFDCILFTSEDRVDGWRREIRSEITSYVHSAIFQGIGSWGEPTLFRGILRNLSSLRALWTYETEIPGELPGHNPREEFGGGITTLALLSPRCTLSTIVSMSLSPPNLKKLIIANEGLTLKDPPSTYPIALRPLHTLALLEDVNEVAEVLAECRFTSRKLCLDIRKIQITNIQRLLTLSSEIIVELKLKGVAFAYYQDTGTILRASQTPRMKKSPSPFIYHHFPLSLLYTSTFNTKTPRPASRPS